MNLAERVALALKSIGKNNDILAESLGVHKNTIAAYKKCDGDLKGVVLEGLVARFGFSPGWLLTGEGPPLMQDQEPELSQTQLSSGRNVLLMKHIDVVKRFRKTELAIKANIALSDIEALDGQEFLAEVYRLHGKAEGLRRAADRMVLPERRQVDQPETIPEGVDRRKTGS